jgi:alpha-glutamyl/putrescinyl thymine pyrophosphorylase-like protein
LLQIDEAFWLIFLATHFGKHPKHGWRRLQDVYSGLGSGTWTWQRTSANPAAFRSWLQKHGANVGGGFSNHRKYESLRTDSTKGTAAVVQSYIDWVGPSRSHAQRIGELVRAGGNHPQSIFDRVYNDMKVLRFGRLGKFDFLALVGRLDLAPISPGSAYLKGATGPLKGARLLFGSASTPESVLEDWLRDLDTKLGVGMQVMEDALCNWQKSPTQFVHFRG